MQLVTSGDRPDRALHCEHYRMKFTMGTGGAPTLKRRSKKTGTNIIWNEVCVEALSSSPSQLWDFRQEPDVAADQNGRLLRGSYIVR